MNTFLLLGRPRSRTAWAANFLTVPPHSFCYHEGLADSGMSFIRLRERMAELNATCRGNADTGLIHELDAALSTFPNARLVLLTENETSWRMFCHRSNAPQQMIDEVDHAYWQAKRKLEGRALFMPCQAPINDERAARVLWEHCLPAAPFDVDRWEMLRNLNVQVVPESLPRRLGLPNS